MIEIKNISKQYNNKVVLDDVSLNIRDQAITTFIGANGAGKSTLLSIMSRLVEQDKGSIIIDGKDIDQWDNKELSKKISILRQTNNINMRLTIEELVSFGRFPHSNGRLSEKDQEIIARSLSYLKLEDIKHKYLDQLSGGQRQRAYIAMVMAQDTEYIFLDEPLNNLDMKHSVEIMQILQDLVRDFNKTIVIVIHDINFASKYSDYIVALKDGKLIEDGHTNKIIDKSILKNIFDLDFHIQTTDDMKLCVYY